MIRFVGKDGQTIEFTPHGCDRFDVRPLDFEQLVKVAESNNPSFPVVITNANASATNTEFAKDMPLTLNAVMKVMDLCLPTGWSMVVGYQCHGLTNVSLGLTAIWS